MSGHGISPAWIQVNRFARGEPWEFQPDTLHVIFVKCDTTFLGDVNPTITLSVTCEILEPPPNVTHLISVDCDSTFLGDVNPVIDMNIIVVVVVTP